MDQVQIGVMGKHPGYGDFLQAGVSEHLVSGLNRWLDATLPPLRDQMGAQWGEFWDDAQDLRFWIGRAILGRTIAGVFRPSRDRVGRRFPLLMLIEGGDIPVPLGAGVPQDPWDAMVDQLNRMEPGDGVAALLEGAQFSVMPEQETHGPTLWAHHPEGDLAALLASAAEPDAARAQLTRSYWWAPGMQSEDINRAATWLACPGLPAPPAFGWLLGGVPGETEIDA